MRSPSRISVAAGALAALLPGLVVAQGTTPPAPSVISAEVLSRHVQILADDSMMGRNTPSPAIELTAAYVAEHFQKAGLKPGGDDGGWLQRWPLKGDANTMVPNTVGILEGTDPKLKDEYVVLTAHMDHVGFRTGTGGADSIYNGADDNAAGTAGILELVKAFTQPNARPKRSLIFVTVSGEEKGLLGSDYFAAHPPVPLKQIVANVNFDMIGRWSTDTVMVIGLDHSDIGAAYQRVLERHPDVAIVPQPNPASQRMFSSDHYSFAKRGVPIVKFGGPGPGNRDYHQPSDSPDKVEAERAAKIMRFAYYLTHEIANADARPEWKAESFETYVKIRPE